MHKSPIFIIPLLKAGAHCWEANVDGAKLIKTWGKQLLSKMSP